VRIAPETSTTVHTGRSADAAGRGRRLASGILATAISKGLGVISPLLMVPMTYQSLGPSVFGLWMAIMALTSVVTFADLGLGNGLMTRLAPCFSNGDTNQAKRYVATAYAVLGSTAVVLLCALYAATHAVPWSAVFNTGSSVDASLSRDIATICLSVFILNIPVALVVRVQYAYQMVGISNAWQAAGNIGSLLCASGAVALEMSPQGIIFAAVVGPLLSNLANTWWLFRYRLPTLTPNLRHVDRRVTRSLMSIGGNFFVLTIVTALAINSDQIIVAHTLDLSAVAIFAVVMKICALLGMVINVVSMPLWPANGDALARGDLSWVRRTTTLMAFILAGTVAVAGLLVILLSRSALGHWMGYDGNQASLMVGMVLWWLVIAFISPLFMVQNAAGVITPQLIGWALYLAASVPLKVLAVQRYGLAIVPFAGVAAYILFVVPSAIVGYRRTISMHSSKYGRDKSRDDGKARAVAPLVR
jgi:O-antigen/teichoic acid export membrane protein